MEIDKLAWICIKERKLLCARSHNANLFYLPGGKREAGESDAQALVREIREELSVILDPDRLDFAGTWKAPAHGKPAGTMVKLTCYSADFAGTLQAASEIAELAWLCSTDLERCSAALVLVIQDLHSQGLLD